MKTLKDFMKSYRQKSDELQSKIDGLAVDDKEDIAGNKDDVFKGSKVKPIDRKGTRHGYDAGEDEKVYEEVELDEKKLTPAEMKKREEVAKAIESGNPNMPMAKKMAIATATAKRVAESSDAYGKSMDTIKKNNITNPDKDKISKLQAMMAAEKKPVKEEADKEDMPFKGPYRKVGDREDEYGNKVKNVAKHLAKKAMKANEEVEDLEELSNKTLGSYIKKASTQAFSKAYASGAQSQGPEDGAASEKNLMKANKRVLGVHNAVDRMAKEEVEDLDELSVAKLKDYRTKARADAHDADDVDDERRYRKRAAGSNTAGKKIVRQGGNLGEQAELDESAKIADHLIKRYGDNVRKSHVMSASNDFGVDASKLAKAVRTKLGKDMLGEEVNQTDRDKAIAHYKADLPNILKDIRGKKKSHSDLRREYGGSWKRLANSTADEHGHNYNRSHLLAVGKQHMEQHMQEEVQIDEVSSATKDSYVKKAVPQMGGLFKKSGQDADAARKYYNRKNTVRKIANEEAEDLNELSKDNLTNYMDKASDARGHRSLSTKKVDNRYAGVKKASDKLTKEDSEQIDELSKATLKSYGNKASDQVRDYVTDKPTSFKASMNNMKREKGLQSLQKRKTNEEADQIDELSKATMGRYINKAATKMGSQGVTAGLKIAADEKSSKNFKNMGKREKGIATAVKKLTKALGEEAQIEEGEEKGGGYDGMPKGLQDRAPRGSSRGAMGRAIAKKERNLTRARMDRAARKMEEENSKPDYSEAIDEISKPTLGRYINKAKDSIDTASYRQGHKEAHGSSSKALERKLTKRHKGISMAVGKLTKEDIINRTIEKYVAEDYELPTLVDKFVERISTLSEGQVGTLVAVFESLNEHNQIRMIDLAETKEGLNSLLNFALDMRYE